MMTSHQTYASAIDAYRKRHESGLSTLEIVTALYDGILRNLEEAKNAHTAGDPEKMCALNEKTFRILGALQCHIDFEKGGAVAAALDSFYTGVFVRLARVTRISDPGREYDDLQRHVRQVAGAWKTLVKKTQESAPQS